MKHHQELKKVAFTATFTALAVVFALITKYVPGLNLQMPQEGTVFGFSMLPIILVGLILGPKYGILSGIVYGLVNVLIDGGLYAWQSLFSDYIIAFGVLGLAGFFRKGIYHWIRFLLATISVGFLRYLSHAIGGAIIFAEYAPEGINPWFYSFVMYNAPYMATSIAVTAILGVLVLPKVRELAIEFGFIKPIKTSEEKTLDD